MPSQAVSDVIMGTPEVPISVMDWRPEDESNVRPTPYEFLLHLFHCLA